MITHLKLAASGDEQNPDIPTVTFEMFYSAYPKKRAREDALKAWGQGHIQPDDLKKLLPAIAAQKKTEDWRKDKGKYIPLPASWIRGKRWNDELECDLTMGVCSWNCNGNRDGETRCTLPATVEKRGVCYCAGHGERVR